MLLDFPVIGDIVISPNSKVKDEKGNDKYDLLECDGSVVDEGLHPVLSGTLPNTDNYVYEEVSFDVSGFTNPIGIVGNSDNFWIADDGTNKVYKYTKDWSYTGESFTINSDAVGVSLFEGYIWIVKWNPNALLKYNLDGTYTGESTSLNGLDTGLRGIVKVDGFLWIMSAGADRIYKYNLDGTATGFSFYIGSYTDQSKEVVHRNGHLWVVDASSATIRKFSLDGSLIDTIDVSPLDTDPHGLWFDGDILYVLGNSNGKIFKYKSNINLPNITPLSDKIDYKIVADLS
jgi:hypothetical protein